MMYWHKRLCHHRCDSRSDDLSDVQVLFVLFGFAFGRYHAVRLPILSILLINVSMYNL